MRLLLQNRSAMGRTAVVAMFGTLAAVASLAVAEPAFQRDFNDGEVSWRLLDRKAPAHILSHERVPGGARDHGGVERLVIAAPAGESVGLFVPSTHLAVLPELQARVWVKANRPAVQLGLRIILPRTPDGSGGAARTVVVRGATYNRTGQWQQLTIVDVPKLLAAQVRVLRSVQGASIDSKQAYVDAVVLIVPGDPTGTEVYTDALEVDGVLVPRDDEVRLTGYDSAAAASSPAAVAGSIRLQGDLLLVEDKPFLPRVIEWRGEALAFLADRGFNVVLLAQAPDDEQIAEAERLGLWFMCVPPRPEAIARQGLGRSGDRVLGWLLRDEAVELDANYSTRWAELIRRQDRVSGRPIIVAPDADWAAASRSADILVARHRNAHRFSPADYEAWLTNRQRSARLGTPVWTALATQFGNEVQQQAAALTGEHAPPPSRDLAQLEAMLRAACLRGIRGFVFHSSSSLAEPDAFTRQRAAALELMNRRLQLLEPWLAAGSIIGRIGSSDDNYSCVLMQVDRARLLLPVSQAPPQPAAMPPGDVAFLVPGVPESSQVFVLSPVAMRALPAHRVAGGTRLMLPASGEAMALITEDPQIIRNLRERTVHLGPGVIRLQRDLAAQRAAMIGDHARRLTQMGSQGENAARTAASVGGQLPQIDALIAAGRSEQAFELALWANRALELAADEQMRTVPKAIPFESNPLARSYDQIVACASLRRATEAPRGENLLYGGDFEDLGQLTQFGWRNYQHPTRGVESHVALSPSEPKFGGYCLELQAARTAAGDVSELAQQPPAWIVSPPVVLHPGQVVEITGWVRVEAPAANNGEVLEIVDSLGGPELSLAIGPTGAWQPFRMIRAAAEPAELRLTFALVGLGTARVDAVMVRTLAQPVARRLPPAHAINR